MTATVPTHTASSYKTPVAGNQAYKKKFHIIYFKITYFAAYSLQAVEKILHRVTLKVEEMDFLHLQKKSHNEFTIQISKAPVAGT